MRGATDFEEVNEELPVPRSLPMTANDVTDPTFFTRSSFADIQEILIKLEYADDMFAIVAEAPEHRRRTAANQVVELLRTTTAAQIVRKHKELEKRKERARANYHLRHGLKELENQLTQAKLCWAGLQTHEQAVCDFLQYRAETVLSSGSLSQRWTWSLDEDVPSAPTPNQIRSLPATVTEVPHELKCPISHTLMQDAVTATDGHTYSREAIERWFSIRTSSPMTGLALTDTTLTENRAICDKVSAWIDGDDQATALSVKGSLTISFASPYGTFERRVAGNTTMAAVHKLAFRGLGGRYTVFQLAKDNIVLPASPNTVLQRGLRAGDRVTIRVADEADLAPPRASAGVVGRLDICLIKVYASGSRFLFAYWTKTTTAATMASILWKYWRHMSVTGQAINTSDLFEVWHSLRDSGDHCITGSPQDGCENLSQYLNRDYCTGRLAEEDVYRDTNVGFMNALQPLVFKVEVDKARRPEQLANETDKLTRLDVLKQMFEALINRMLAYNYKTHVGLVTVKTVPTLAQPTSHILENFRASIKEMSASGDTALWDALALANDQLTQYALRYPDAKKRIICISDGEDTKSISQTSHGAYWLLKQNNVALDSICLGYNFNTELRAASYLLGCYSFHPESLENALAISEMEPFLSLSERPALKAAPGAPQTASVLLQRFRYAMSNAMPTVVDDETVPARKVHPNMHDDFIELTASTAARSNSTGSVSGARSNLRMSRILREMQKVVQAASPVASVFVSESDATFWKVVMSGPNGTPYEGGVFVFYLHADEGYPTFAPKGRFITKIKHPNINAHGRICHSLFSRDWTSDTSMSTCIDVIYGMLLTPEFNDPVNTTAVLNYHHDQVEYADQVREFVRAYASKSKEQWKLELLGEVEGSGDEDEGADGDEDEVMSEDFDAVSDDEVMSD
ncbi:ubiquitin-conjugating enzyme E2 N [Elasticomyces elasticus]|nr:ubiquitin-conjugating enzyme E2 N [Elasticomyces elasticus]